MKTIKFFINNSYKTFISILKLLKYGSLKYSKVFIPSEKQDIIILGNGPSLRENFKNNMETLKERDTFAVNKFCLTPEFSCVKPKFYLLIDPAFYTNRNTSSKFINLQKQISEALIQKVDWDMTLFIPAGTDMKDDWTDLSIQNKNIKIIYINSNDAIGFRSIVFKLYKYNLAMPAAQNVLVGAIFLSLNMGYRNIYLLGADHSWTEDLRVNSKNQLYIYNKHYYGQEHTIFYKGIEQKEIWKMHEILFAWSRTFMSYFILRDYAKKVNAHIYNLTEDSYIDAFQKAKFEEIFQT